MDSLTNHIIRAVDIAEAAGTAVTMYPNQVRHLLNRIAELEQEINLLKAGAEKIEEMAEQFRCGEAAYELGHGIDDKLVGDTFRMGYAWRAYFD